MTAKASGSRKLKRNKLPKFNNDIYFGIPASNLILYAVHYLLEQHIEVKLEDIVFACFLLFPHKFALKQFPRWPDSALVSRRLSDCRSKGYFALNTELGFKLTAKGSRLAEKTAKALGIFKAKRTVQAAPAKYKNQATPIAKKIRSVRSKDTASEPAKIVPGIASQPKASGITSLKKTKIVRKNKNASIAPIKKSRASSTQASPTKQAQKVTPSAPTQKVPPAGAKKTKKRLPIAAPVKKVATSEIKVQPAVQAQKKQTSHKEKTAPPKQDKKTSVIRAKKVSSSVAAVKQAKKTQAVRREKTRLPVPQKQTEQHAVQIKKTLKMPVPKVVVKAQRTQIPKPVPQKKQWNDVVKKRLSVVTLAQQITPPRTVKPTPIVPGRSAKAKKARPEKATSFVASPITKEVKERAGKFTRMMERSDAYLNYKKHAGNAKISEFDFRSLLLCTMESSPETLARNVQLFKGYASINNRQDLTVFLNFCEDRFFYLLKAQKKPTQKAKQERI